MISQPVFTLWVDGIPKGQPRARAFAMKLHGGGATARLYDPGTAEGWKGQVAAAVRPQLPAAPLDGPLAVTMGFAFPRPAKLMRRKDPEGEIMHTAKPDADNAAKAVLDALTQIGLWHDDAQVCALRVTKAYHAKTGRPGMLLHVERLVEDAVTP